MIFPNSTDYREKNQHNQCFSSYTEKIFDSITFKAIAMLHHLSSLYLLDVSIKLKYWKQAEVVALDLNNS